MERFLNQPFLSLAFLPTPLEYTKELSKMLQINLYIKRDDETGLSLGGNKVRKLEFLLADAINKGADIIITTGSLQSNHARLTAAAANKVGLKAILLLKGKKPEKMQGNLLLDKILGAEVHFIEAKSYQEINEFAFEMMEKLKKEGHNPYYIPVGGSTPIGALGYVKAYQELMEQASKQNLKIDYIVNAVGSGGTSAGLEVGKRLFENNVKIVGISVDAEKSVFKKDISEIASSCLANLNIDKKVLPEEVIVFDEYIGEEGYGKKSMKGTEALLITARKEGIILDPVYTAKAMAGLIDLAQKGYFEEGSNVVFFHTGGTPAIFDIYADGI